MGKEKLVLRRSLRVAGEWDVVDTADFDRILFTSHVLHEAYRWVRKRYIQIGAVSFIYDHDMYHLVVHHKENTGKPKKQKRKKLRAIIEKQKAELAHMEKEEARLKEVMTELRKINARLLTKRMTPEEKEQKEEVVDSMRNSRITQTKTVPLQPTKDMLLARCPAGDLGYGTDSSFFVGDMFSPGDKADMLTTIWQAMWRAA